MRVGTLTQSLPRVVERAILRLAPDEGASPPLIGWGAGQVVQRCALPSSLAEPGRHSLERSRWHRVELLGDPAPQAS